jgi:hypothetical protein
VLYFPLRGRYKEKVERALFRFGKRAEFRTTIRVRPPFQMEKAGARCSPTRPYFVGLWQRPPTNSEPHIAGSGATRKNVFAHRVACSPSKSSEACGLCNYPRRVKNPGQRLTLATRGPDDRPTKRPTVKARVTRVRGHTGGNRKNPSGRLDQDLTVRERRSSPGLTVVTAVTHSATGKYRVCVRWDQNLGFTGLTQRTRVTLGMTSPVR